MEIPVGFRKSQSSDVDSAHVVSPHGFTRTVILHENVHATCVVTLSPEELGTIFRNNFRGIT